MHSFYTTMVGSMFQAVFTSQSLSPRTQFGSLILKAEGATFSQTCLFPWQHGMEQVLVLDSNGERGSAEMLTRVAASRAENSKLARSQPCTGQGSNPGL